MNVFTDRELNLVRRLKDRPPQTVLQIKESCRHHSLCFPLPLFRLYKLDDESFEAQWNDYHRPGTSQPFKFSEIL